MSVSFWFKLNFTTVNSGTKIISKSGYGSSYGWDFQLELWGSGQGALQFRIPSSGTAVDYSNYYCPDEGCDAWNTDHWYHVVGVFIPSVAVDLYVDGARMTRIDNTITATMFTNNVNLDIGRRPIGADYFNGLIDEVRIYESVLLEEEVESLSFLTLSL